MSSVPMTTAPSPIIVAARGLMPEASVPSASPDFRPHIRIGRQARANEIPVAIRALHSRHRRPELEVLAPWRRKRGALPRIWMRPGRRRHATDRVRRILEDVVLLVRYPGLDLSDLVANRAHR